MDDVAQLCGGAGVTAALLVKRVYRDGPNFDIIVGDRSHAKGWPQLPARLSSASLPKDRPDLDAVHGHERFAHLNRAINHAAWVRSRRVPVPLGKLAGEVAFIQLRGGRHFLAEHPQGSAMFQLAVWKMLARERQVVKYWCTSA